MLMCSSLNVHVVLEALDSFFPLFEFWEFIPILYWTGSYWEARDDVCYTMVVLKSLPLFIGIQQCPTTNINMGSCTRCSINCTNQALTKGSNVNLTVGMSRV